MATEMKQTKGMWVEKVTKSTAHKSRCMFCDKLFEEGEVRIKAAYPVRMSMAAHVECVVKKGKTL